jgi:SAM-dependent methyltransferase
MRLSSAPSSWADIAAGTGVLVRSSHALPVASRDIYRLIARLHRKRLRSIVRRRTVRDLPRVARIYGREYEPSTADFLLERSRRRDVFLVDGQPLCVDGWFTFAYRAELLERALTIAGAGNVLEVGSGRGILPALLALRRPELQLTGIDLVAEGVDRSYELAADPPIELLRLAQIEELTPEGREALGRLSFVRGDAAAMPFEHGAFDVSYTCLSLEQMPRSVPDFVREMARVTREYCIFLETFAEANGLLGRAQLRSLDYFRGRYEGFSEFGLEPVYFTTKIPQKIRFKAGLLVARVV